MIESFADKDTESIWNKKFVRKLPKPLQRKVLRRLRYIDMAERVEDLMVPPSNKLEKKTGDMKGFYAIWVNTQWRIIFKWTDNVAHDVQLVDYH